MRRYGKCASAVGQAMNPLLDKPAPWVQRFLTVMGQIADKRKATLQS